MGRYTELERLQAVAESAKMRQVELDLELSKLRQECAHAADKRRDAERALDTERAHLMRKGDLIADRESDGFVMWLRTEDVAGRLTEARNLIKEASDADVAPAP